MDVLGCLRLLGLSLGPTFFGFRVLGSSVSGFWIFGFSGFRVFRALGL